MKTTAPHTGLIDRVTITGADDSIGPERLAWLSEFFPYVEWGILFSPTKQGSVRYPSATWIERFLGVASTRGEYMRLSAHVCGDYARKLLLGQNILPAEVMRFKRIQLNFRANDVPCDIPAFDRALEAFRGKQVIFQLDQLGQNHHLDALLDRASGHNIAVLFDGSGGTGLLPDRWRAPRIRDFHGKVLYHGYAGGLGPKVLPREAARITEAAAGNRVWIDMESGVRRWFGRRLSFDRMWKVLTQALPFVCADRRTMDSCRE